MHLEDATVINHDSVQGGYRLLVLRSPRVAPEVRPGQFVHLRVPGLDTAVLRRPFSVYNVEGGELSILYKDVGRGTAAMTRLRAGETVSLIGPLGRGFPAAQEGRCPVLVAGGYGMAALYLVARGSAARGTVFVGGRSAQDILCVKEFESVGWDVKVATEDGSLGVRGLVTDALDGWLEQLPADRVPELFACGPNGMLRAVGERALARGWTAWLSMDTHMGCGVGACLTCVQKIRTAAGGWEWARVCREGPVFECRDVVWDDE